MKKIFQLFFFQLFFIDYQILPAEQNEPDLPHCFKAGQRITDSGKRHVRSRFERITESASGNGGKGNGCDAVLRSQPQRAAVTGGKLAEPPLNPDASMGCISFSYSNTEQKAAHQYAALAFFG